MTIFAPFFRKNDEEYYEKNGRKDGSGKVSARGVFGRIGGAIISQFVPDLTKCAHRE